MNVVLKFLKDWTLPIAIVLGVVGYDWFSHLSFITSYMIFLMLLLTFSQISFTDMQIRPWHVILLMIEIFGGILIYVALAPINKILAQAIMLCVICPTATAAAVITNKLGGSIAQITTYKLICNTAVAMVVPILFPIINPVQETSIDFLEAVLHILRKIFPLLILPYLVAQLFRYFIPKVNLALQRIGFMSFYIWAFCLVIVMAQTTKAVIENPMHGYLFPTICAASLVVCLLQFFIGKRIGRKYGDSITSGQSLGQKNTILAIWMAHTYLHPLSALGPGAYVVWQNLFNSYQLWKVRKDKEKALAFQAARDAQEAAAATIEATNTTTTTETAAATPQSDTPIESATIPSNAEQNSKEEEVKK